MVFDVKFNSELNALEYYNPSEIEVDFDKIPIKMDFSSSDSNNSLDYINLFKNLNLEISEKYITWTQKALIGRSFKDVSPKAYELILPIFKEVLDSKTNKTIKFYIFEDNYAKFYFKVNIVYSQGDLFLIFDDCSDSLKKYENATFDYTDVPTWYDVVPKAIIQDDSIIQINKILADLVKRSEKKSNNLR